MSNPYGYTFNQRLIAVENGNLELSRELRAATRELAELKAQVQQLLGKRQVVLGVFGNGCEYAAYPVTRQCHSEVIGANT
jgi:hypothetical protein